MDFNYYFKRYGDYSDIDLPKTYRVYFDAYCDEFKRYPVESKLLDLAYVIIHGFDIKKAIRTILTNNPHVGESAVHRAILSLTAVVNHVENLNYRRNSLDTDIDILIEDLLRCYRLPLDNSIPHFLQDDFREVFDSTVYRSNGWEIASQNVNQYQMYRDEDFVFYPGDAELLQKYHQKDIESGNIGQIFPGGPCPEPWYGNPMTARIIILGDMPRQDDFISPDISPPCPQEKSADPVFLTDCSEVGIHYRDFYLIAGFLLNKTDYRCPFAVVVKQSLSISL